MSTKAERPRLILGSASPRRSELLAQIGIVPDVIQPADIDEDVLLGELPRPYVQRVSGAKCLALQDQFPNDFILTADTTVSVGRRILGKPVDRNEARQFLNLLSARRHRVLTSTALLTPGGNAPIVKVSETAVKISKLHPNAIEAFLDSDDWQGKAGGYSIQGTFAKHISWIQGTYPSVMGLDVHQTWNLLTGNGWQPSGL